MNKKIAVGLVSVILIISFLMSGCNLINLSEWLLVEYESVSETVYAAEDIDVLKNSRGDVSVDIEKGKSLVRIGYGEKWSKIKYNGEEFYVETSKLTEEKPDTEIIQGDNSTTAQKPDSNPIENVTFEEVDELVYATENVNVRSSTYTDIDNKVGQVKAGTELKRIGYNHEWSKVLYNGEVCYVKSAYLSTEKISTEPPIIADIDGFVEVNETVYAYSDQDGDLKCDGNCNEEGANVVIVNLYPLPYKENMKYSIECGTELKRTGILIEDEEMGYGWSRVEYRGEILYARNSCITTTKPHADN